jgi:hypothetical protein
VIGDADDEPDVAIRHWYGHLLSRLKLPSEVAGIEDFQWEEFYVVGPATKRNIRPFEGTSLHTETFSN